MSPDIVEIVLNGNPTDRDLVARQICQSRKKDILKTLWDNVHTADAGAREVIIKIAGVLGGLEFSQEIEDLSKKDPEANVRIAAIVAKQYLGKVTYDKLSDEINRFNFEETGESGQTIQPTVQEVPAQTESQTSAPKVKFAGDSEEQKNDPDQSRGVPTFLSKKVLIAGLCIVMVATVLYMNRTHFESDQEVDRQIPQSPGRQAIALTIKERIDAVNKFKAMYLDPESPASRFPMTLELRSMQGDTYGDLFERVYGNILGTETGMNTIGAFWRHMNFGTSETQNMIDLMDMETESELLLFPNPVSMGLQLNLNEGSAAYQSFNNEDPDLEISIRVNSVVVR